MKAEIKPRIQLENREPLADNIPMETPWVVFVDPSDACNFRCRFCPTGDRVLMKRVGRPLRVMGFELYKHVIDSICAFDRPIKVLRLYKDGEPLVNKDFARMVRYGKESGCCERVDTTTNASLLSPARNLRIIDAGLDRINISIEGVNAEQYKDFSGVHIDFDEMVANIAHFYEHRAQCEMVIKVNGDVISQEDLGVFFDTFGDICDGIFVEHAMNCWSGFGMDGVEENQEIGIYGQPLQEVQVCPYVFYSISVNSDGMVSACFLDWARELLVGDVTEEPLKDIWNGARMDAYRRMFLEKKRDTHPVCGSCSQLSHGMPVDLDDEADELLGRYGW